jgi:hypothetical protein
MKKPVVRALSFILCAGPRLSSKFDIPEFPCDNLIVKGAKSMREKKTAGTLAVEKHRPLMNKLSDADRRRLRRRAAELLYGSETASVGR